jgi:hypothetical protein
VLIEVSNVPAMHLFNADGEPVGMLSSAEAAAYLGVSIHTLRKWRRRSNPQGPRYFRRNSLVRYRREDLDRFVNLRSVDPERRAAR